MRYIGIFQIMEPRNQLRADFETSITFEPLGIFWCGFHCCAQENELYHFIYVSLSALGSLKFLSNKHFKTNMTKTGTWPKLVGYEYTTRFWAAFPTFEKALKLALCQYDKTRHCIKPVFQSILTFKVIKNEPEHDKIKSHVHPAKTQISGKQTQIRLGRCSGWSECSLATKLILLILLCSISNITSGL